MRFKRKVVFCIAGLTIVICATPIFASELHHSPTRSYDAQNEEAKKADNIFKVGGQVRARGDFTANQNLGDFSFIPDTRDEQILSRTRINLSIEPIKQIKGFVQGQFYSRQNHSDYSKANLYQAYIGFSDPEHIPIELKIGRQEICYGSAFFLGSNDFYDGLVWDGAKIRILPRDYLWIDLIAARYVKLNENTSDKEPALYGAYSSYSLAQDTDIDLYFLYHKGGFKFFHTDLPDSPRWFTLGTRIAGKVKGRFDYEIEPLYQFGKIDNLGRGIRDTINAYGGHIEAGYTIVDSKYKPRLFAGYAFGSGDNDPRDKKYGEFHGNVYNDNYLVGDTSLIPDLSGITVGDSRASGMNILIGGVSLNLHPKLNLNLDYHYFLADKAPAGISKNLGNEVDLIVTRELLDNVNIITGANRFFTGKFFEDASGSGKDINYFYIQAQIEF